MRPVLAADLGGKEHGITKLLHIASVSAEERARRLVPSKHHRALDRPHSLPASQHICTCNHHLHMYYNRASSNCALERSGLMTHRHATSRNLCRVWRRHGTAQHHTIAWDQKA